MRVLFLTISTALAGFFLSFVLPYKAASTINRMSEANPMTAINASEYAAGGFGQLLPTPTKPAEAIAYAEYQQKVKQLLAQLDKTTNDRSAYRTIAFTNDSLINSGNSPQKDEQTTIQPITNNQQLTTNLGELQENPQDRIRRIVLLGDSMIDTLGRDLPHLRKLLETAYPDKLFALYNYGHGATNLDQGCIRLTEETNYANTRYPPILSMKPQIIVLESFAYNHWSGASHDLDRHWITLARCIDTIKKESPKTQIILAATIAPNNTAVPDVIRAWTFEAQQEWVKTTHAYLQNMFRFAQSEGYPFADAYTPSLEPSGNGQLRYIDATDHLHPSEAGKLLFSEEIVKAIEKNQMIQ